MSLKITTTFFVPGCPSSSTLRLRNAGLHRALRWHRCSLFFVLPVDVHGVVQVARGLPSGTGHAAQRRWWRCQGCPLSTAWMFLGASSALAACRVAVLSLRAMVPDMRRTLRAALPCSAPGCRRCGGRGRREPITYLRSIAEREVQHATRCRACRSAGWHRCCSLMPVGITDLIHREGSVWALRSIFGSSWPMTYSSRTPFTVALVR